jgi:peroxiredoxin Q/BCP
MNLLSVNEQVPSLTLKNQNSQDVQISEICKGTTLLYFYPKALTSGCTTQACALRDGNEELSQLGVKVYGISPDNPDKLTRFIAKENLNFELLSDPDFTVAQAFGAYGLKKMCGRESMGVFRVSFLIKDGKVIANFPKVKPKEHLDMILDFLKKDQ